MCKKLEGKTAVVTGGSRGIGRGVALAFASQGANVVVNYVSNDKAAKEVVAEIEKRGAKGLAVKADVGKKADAENLIDSAVKEFGRIDILVNNAAINRDGFIHKMSGEDWDAVMETNVKGVFNCIQAAGKYMRKKDLKEGEIGGKIINVTSRAGVEGSIGQINYAASKAAVIGLTKTVAREWGRFKVNANTVYPSSWTDMTRRGLTEEKKKQWDAISALPGGMTDDPEKDIGPAFVFLASEDSNYITGQFFSVDGGRLI
jgi:3-oxoacyl-[acyl-carrier protein] reductase